MWCTHPGEGLEVLSKKLAPVQLISCLRRANYGLVPCTYIIACLRPPGGSVITTRVRLAYANILMPRDDTLVHLVITEKLARCSRDVS